jgi:hypothetical protein
LNDVCVLQKSDEMRSKTRCSKKNRVRLANSERDLNAVLPSRHVTCGEVSLSVTCYHSVENIPEETRCWALSLLERNMAEQYRAASPDSWDPVAKEAEMFSSASRYLVLRSKEEHVAFSHFRFDMDLGEDVLYCYEIQIEERWQRKGIGR